MKNEPRQYFTFKCILAEVGKNQCSMTILELNSKGNNNDIKNYANARFAALKMHLMHVHSFDPNIFSKAKNTCSSLSSMVRKDGSVYTCVNYSIEVLNMAFTEKEIGRLFNGYFDYLCYTYKLDFILTKIDIDIGYAAIYINGYSHDI